MKSLHHRDCWTAYFAHGIMIVRGCTLDGLQLSVGFLPLVKLLLIMVFCGLHLDTLLVRS